MIKGHQRSRRPRSRSLGDLPGTPSTVHSAPAVDVTKKEQSFKERLCSNDSTKFRKYIDNTTTHGVVRIFTGKSKVRRLFWGAVFLSAFAMCLALIIQRFISFEGVPTATTVTQKVNQEGILFPAVTICNANLFKRSVFESVVDENELNALMDILKNPSEACKNRTISDILSRSNVSYRHIQDVARHQAKDLIVQCIYAGEDCNHTDFSEELTRLGYCYTFNSGRLANRRLLKSEGIGTRYGLSLILNIEQDDYLDIPIPAFSVAGVRVAIHPQDQPPIPEDLSIAVPPGRNVFIGIHQKNVSDRSTISRKEGRCRDVGDTSGFNFLQGRFQYSSSACLKDCFFTNITEECRCIETGVNIPPNSSRYHGIFPDCSSVDLCCLLEYYYGAIPCDCPVACKYTTYDVTTSYLAFPSTVVAEKYATMYNTTVDYFYNNFLALNIYYQSQNTDIEETVNADSVPNLLSAVGGLMGLFLGMSVISMLEFVTWLLDEFKDRCFGVNDRKLEEWYDAAEAEFEALETKQKDEKQDSTTSKLAETSLVTLAIDKHKPSDDHQTTLEQKVNHRTN